MSSNKGRLRPLALGSAHEKFDLSNVFNMFRLLFARSYSQVNKPIKMQINEIVIHFIVFSSFRRLVNLEKSDCRSHFLLQAKFHSKCHRHMFTLKMQSCCLPYFSVYVPKLGCFYNDVLMDGISLKCSIQYYNFTCANFWLS